MLHVRNFHHQSKRLSQELDDYLPYILLFLPDIPIHRHFRTHEEC